MNAKKEFNELSPPNCRSSPCSEAKRSARYLAYAAELQWVDIFRMSLGHDIMLKGSWAMSSTGQLVYVSSRVQNSKGSCCWGSSTNNCNNQAKLARRHWRLGRCRLTSAPHHRLYHVRKPRNGMQKWQGRYRFWSHAVFPSTTKPSFEWEGNK